MGTWARTLPHVPTVPSYGSSYTYDPIQEFRSQRQQGAPEG